MLTKVEAHDGQGHTLSLPLNSIGQNYTVKEIEGLDPVKSTIVSSSFAQLDGSQFQSAKRESRNIVMKLGIEPYSGGISVKEARATLYGYFMPKSSVGLTFYEDDLPVAAIEGMVESFESVLFSKEPEVAVSIICFDPDFVDPDAQVVSGMTVPGLEELLVKVDGTVECGYVFTLSVDRSINGFTLYKRRPNGDLSIMTVDYDFVAGDVVKISTEPQNKYATLTRGTTTSSIVYAVSQDSNWGPLYPGENYIRAAVAGLSIPYSITFTNRYGGL